MSITTACYLLLRGDAHTSCSSSCSCVLGDDSASNSNHCSPTCKEASGGRIIEQPRLNNTSSSGSIPIRPLDFASVIATLSLQSCCCVITTLLSHCPCWWWVVVVEVSGVDSSVPKPSSSPLSVVSGGEDTTDEEADRDGVDSPEESEGVAEQNECVDDDEWTLIKEAAVQGVVALSFMSRDRRCSSNIPNR